MAPSSSADDGFLLLISVVSIARIFIAIAPGLLEQQGEQLETEFATQVAGSVLMMKRHLEAGPEEDKVKESIHNGATYSLKKETIVRSYLVVPC
jgi:hypothetical protein